MRSKFVQKLVAVGTSAALVASTCGVGTALAWHSQAYEVPTAETPIIQDGYRYVSAAGQHGSAAVGEYAGMNEVVNEIFATPGNGIDETNYMYNPYMGIFGTSANENPDPYIANLMYNWYASANGLEKSEYAMRNMLFTQSKGSSIVSDNSVSPSGTSYTLERRPDVLTINKNAAHQFDEQIKTINADNKIAASDTYIGDAQYRPIEATYDENNMITQIENMWGHAEAAVEVENAAAANNLKVKTRYGNSMDTAYKYELYTKGSILYTMSQLKDFGGSVEKKTIAYVKGISGSDKDATVTLYGEPDPSVSREMSHHIECTVATANNLANLINPATVMPDGVRPAVMASTTCTVEQLAQADVIILADPDNMAYNITKPDSFGAFSDPDWVKLPSSPSAENNWGQSATRSCVGEDGKTYYKNEFWGPLASTRTLADNITAALNDLGTDAAKALAKKNILSCVQEGSSSSDGGSIEAMSQYGIVNAFVYPEIANGLEQYAWWLDNISHIKTDRTAGMVSILTADMSRANDKVTLDSWTSAMSNKITDRYLAGIEFYKKNASTIEGQYSWLRPTADFTAYTPQDLYSTDIATADEPTPAPVVEKQKQTITVKTTSKTFKAKNLKTKAAAFKIGAKAKTSLSYKVTKKDSNITFKAGKVTVKKGTKEGNYAIKVKITAKANDTYKKATKTVKIAVKVK